MPGSQAVGPTLDEVLRQAVPPWLVPVIIAITNMGSVVVLLALFTIDYWFSDHERGAHAISLLLAGTALVTALKAVFAEPRPPEELRLIAASGFSFPSGHATIATIGYGAFALDFEVGSRYTRYTIAAVLIVLIALSRVVLGVHLLHDVVAGIAVGLVFLAVARYLTKHDPRPGFLLAATLGIVALVLGGASQDSMAEFGAILGAAVAWEAFEPIPSLDSLREQLVLLGGGFPVFVTIGYLSLFVYHPTVVAVLLNAVLLAGVIVAPLATIRLLRSDRPTSPARSR